MSRLWPTLGLTAMQSCWLSAWAVLLGWWTDLGHPRALLSAPSIFALLALAALSTQAVGRRATASRAARLALVGLGVMLVLVAVWLDQYPATRGLEWLGLLVGALARLLGQTSGPAEAFALGLFIWWRGVRLGSQSATYPDVESAFRWGIGTLVAFALVVGLTTRPSQLVELEGDTTIFIVAFFFFSLLTLALARLESLRTRTRALAVNSQWLGVLVAVAGMVVLLALLIGQLMSFDLLLVATRPLFDVLGQLLIVLIYLIVIPLAYVVELLIFAVLSLLRPGDNQQLPTPMPPADVDNLLQRLLGQVISPELLVALKAVGAALLLAVALAVIARAVARWRPSSADADATAEERESVWQAGGWRGLLRAWLGALFRRRQQVGEGWNPGAVEPTWSIAQAPRSVRELYRELLRLGELAGATRAIATTPLEHQPALERSLAPEAPVGEVTAAYVEARYAELDVAPERVAELQAQLDHLEARDAARLTGDGAY